MRRLSTVAAALIALALALVLGPAAPPATATPGAPPGAAQGGAEADLSVIQVSGLLDPVLADFVEGAIADAERRGAVWLVLQVNSTGTVVGEERVAELVERVRTASVPVGGWGRAARAHAGMAQLAAVADAVGIAPGSRLGRLGEPAVAAERFRAPFRRGRWAASATAPSPPPRATAGAHRAAGSHPRRVPRRPRRRGHPGGPHREGPRRTVANTPVFAKLSVGDQLMHTVASPRWPTSCS